MAYYACNILVTTVSLRLTGIFHSLVVPFFSLLCCLATLFFARSVLIPKCTFVSNVVH